MRSLILLLFLIQFHTVTAQHTKRFEKLTLNLMPSDSSNTESYYSDGSIKAKGKLLYYDMPEYNYSKKAGLWLEYYNSGEIKTTSNYDDLGNLLSRSLYDLKGSISNETMAISVDSELADCKLYFLRNDEVIIMFSVMNYQFGDEIGQTYLREKGIVKGGKRVGIWSIYNQRGQLEKEVQYPG